MPQRRLRARAPIPCVVFALTLVAATCQEAAPDLDGQPGGAQLLPLGAQHADQLHCRAGDCADWFRLQVPERGDLIVLVESPVGSVGDRPVVVLLADGRARQLEKMQLSPVEGDALITWQAERGYYMIRVEAQDEARTPLPYELSLRFVPPPPPPPKPAAPPKPRFDTVVGEVIEVEGGLGDPDAVLVDRGESHGVLPGQVGRLINGEEMIATVVVVDTYPEGCRARIEGTLSAPISAATRVEIDVPIQHGP